MDETTGEITGYTTKIGGADTVFPFSHCRYVGTVEVKTGTTCTHLASDYGANLAIVLCQTNRSGGYSTYNGINFTGNSSGETSTGDTYKLIFTLGNPEYGIWVFPSLQDSDIFGTFTTMLFLFG